MSATTLELKPSPSIVEGITTFRRYAVCSSNVSVAHIDEHNLKLEFTSLEDIMETKTQEEWEKRNKSLLRLQSLVLGGVTSYHSFLPLFNQHLKKPLAHLVSSYSSSILTLQMDFKTQLTQIRYKTCALHSLENHA